MTEENTLPPEPDHFDLANGFSDDMPLGLWHMWRFTCAYKSGKQAPETMEYLVSAFDKIIAEARQLEGTGAKDRAELVNKHLPITRNSKGRKPQTRRQKSEAFSIAFEMEMMMQTGRSARDREGFYQGGWINKKPIRPTRKNIGYNEAIRRVCKDMGVSETKAKTSYRANKKHCKDLLEMARNGGAK